MAFPLSLELAGSPDAIPARRLGILYAVNTVAAVVGALVAGFVAIPAIGLRASLLVATASAAARRGCADHPRRSFDSRPDRDARSPRAVVVWMATSSGWDREWLAAGGYLYTRFVPTGVDRRAALTAGSLLYYREGATGTVSVKALTGDARWRSTARSTPRPARDMLTQKTARAPAAAAPSESTAGRHRRTRQRRHARVGARAPDRLGRRGRDLAGGRRGVRAVRGREPARARRSRARTSSRRRPDASLAHVPALRRHHLRAVESVDGRRRRALHAGVLSGGARAARRPAASSASGRTPTTSATPICAPSSRRFAPCFPTARCGSSATATCCSLDRTAPLESRLERIVDRLAAARRARGPWRRRTARAVCAAVALRRRTGGDVAIRGGRSGPDRRPDGAGVLRTVCHLCRCLSQSRRRASRSARQRARPPAIERALTAATATQWRDRGAMMIERRGASTPRIATMRRRSIWEPSDTITTRWIRPAAAAARQEDEAERRLRAMILSRAAEAAPRVALAQLLGMRGRFDEAVAIATEATKLAPADASAWEQLASLHADRACVRLGTRRGRLAARIPHSGQRPGISQRAIAFCEATSTAASARRRAIELDPSYADAYNMLGRDSRDGRQLRCDS